MEEQELPRLMKRPELVVYEVVRHLEKARNFRAFITTPNVLKAVQTRLKKVSHKNPTQDELFDAINQAECDGLVYKVHGMRKADSYYWMSREHQQIHGFGSYKIIPYENVKYDSTQLRNLIQQILSDNGPKYATELHRIIQFDMQKFLNYELDFFRKNVLPDSLRHLKRAWIRLENGKYSIEPEQETQMKPTVALENTIVACKQSVEKEEEKFSVVLEEQEKVEYQPTDIPFRTYRLASNHFRKTRDQHIASFTWELKTPHYIKDDFINYLNEELQFQLVKSENFQNVSKMFKLPSTVETWDHHHLKCYLTGLGFHELGEHLFLYQFTGIDILLLTREDILNSFELSLGPAMKLAAFIRRLHDVKY